MNEYIYVVRPTRLEMLTNGPTPDEERIVGQHFEYLKVLHSENVVVLAGRTQNEDESTFGIIIFKAQNDAAANEIMQSDPAVRNNVLHAELFPYRIAVM